MTAQQGAATTSRQSISLLVIDDNPLCVEMLSHALTGPGVEVLAFTSPAEAMEAFSCRRPRIVLSELAMPEMSGLELLERILAIDPADVVLMTTQDSPEAAVKAIKRGAADYLIKPVRIGLLRARIAQLIRDAARSGTRGDEETPEPGENEGIVGRGAPARRVFSRLRQVASHYRTA